MREIKFRAWWKDTMKPIPNFTDDYVIDACNEDIFIVCQYTGLKDKNGVEIYEGDIVSWVSMFNPYAKRKIDAVEWSDLGGWMLMPYCHEPHQAILEVIGNIYEHPELLEAE